MVYDSKTYHTISHIILRNIRLNPEVAVTYICDLKDGRQAARNRLFNMWFKEHDEGDIVKVNKSIGDEFFSGLLIHYENPHFKDIVYKYEEVLDGLANK